MAKQFIIKPTFQKAYDKLLQYEQAKVKKALKLLASYLNTSVTPLGLGIKKLGEGVYEFRIGLALRGVYIEEKDSIVLVLIGSHDEVQRFIKHF